MERKKSFRKYTPPEKFPAHPEKNLEKKSAPEKSLLENAPWKNAP